MFLLALISFSSFSYGQKKQRKFTRQFYFEYGNHNLDSMELLKANKFNKVLSKFELIKIEVIGHTDSDGSNSFNKKLSQKRINTLVEILSNSSRDSLFIPVPKGEEEPIAANTDSTKHQNRRVTVIAYYSRKKGSSKKKAKPKAKPEVAPSNQVRIKKEDLVTGKVLSMPWVRFHGGTDAFLPGAEEILRNIIPVLIANPEVKIEVAGHICCGNDMELSIKRAKKVYDFLVINGVSEKNLTYKGYNNTEPMFRDIMDIRNRRVELRVL